MYYAATDSKFGYIHLKEPTIRKQMKLSDANLQFRTLAQTDDLFYTVNIKKVLLLFIKLQKYFYGRRSFTDTIKTAFYDAFMFDEKGRGLAISDPEKKENLILELFQSKNYKNEEGGIMPKYQEGEAHFAASNTNIAMKKIPFGLQQEEKFLNFKFNWDKPYFWNVYNTPFVNGKSSTGIYSIDFYDEKFGIAVGGDYTQQSDNVNNIATTSDGGRNLANSSFWKNGGYKTCVKNSSEI